MILVIIGLIIAFAVLLHLIHYVLYREMYKLKRPGPKPWPFIGNANLFIGGSNESILNAMCKIMKEYDSPMRFWLGPKYFLSVTKPEDIQVVLQSQNCVDRDSVYRFTNTFCGDGLLAISNPKWKEHRRFLDPCFRQRILQSFVPIFNKEFKNMITLLEPLAESGCTFDMYDPMSQTTLDVVWQTSLGSESNPNRKENSAFVNAGNELIEIMIQRIFKPWYHFDFVFKMTNMAKEQKRLSKSTFGYVEKVIHRRKATFNANEIPEKIKDGSFKTPQIVIDQLLKLEGNHFSDWDMLSEAATIMTTGYETTALIVSYTILMLAMHPEYQQRVFEEILSILPNMDPENYVTYEDIGSLNYTEQVIKETLRLFPVVPMVARSVKEPFDLNGIQVPKGASIIITMMSIHRDEKLWGPKALEFNPDNFLPERVKQRHYYSYIPFSAGPRNCIGFKYALISMKIALSHLIRNYSFSTKLKMNELRLGMDISLKLNNKHMVQSERRMK